MGPDGILRVDISREKQKFSTIFRSYYIENNAAFVGKERHLFMC